MASFRPPSAIPQMLRRSATTKSASPSSPPYVSHLSKAYYYNHSPSCQLPTTSFLSRFFSPSPAHLAMAAAAKQKTQSIIDENAVAVFSKSYCPYCKATKALLDGFGAKYFIIELDQVDDGSAIQRALGELTGQTTVPNIFIKGKHIGGNSDLQAQKGDLQKILKDAGALL